MLSTSRSPSLQHRPAWNAGMTSLVFRMAQRDLPCLKWATIWLHPLNAVLSLCLPVRVVSTATAAAQASAGQLGRQERQSKTKT